MGWNVPVVKQRSRCKNRKEKSLIFRAVSALLIKASVSFSATNDLQTDRNQASLVFFTLCRVISLSAAATGSMWISESGAWNDMMMYTQSSWQTKSDGETRSCFLSGNRTSLSLCTERKKKTQSWKWFRVVLIVCLIWETAARSRAALCTLFYCDINQRWGVGVINVRFVAVRRVKRIKVGGHGEAQIPTETDCESIKQQPERLLSP